MRPITSHRRVKIRDLACQDWVSVSEEEAGEEHVSSRSFGWRYLPLAGIW